MNLILINKIFPTEESALRFLETIIWNGKPICPYCKSEDSTALRDGKRYHCNTCNTSYSATVNTMFHKTKIEIRKWFYLIAILSSGREMPSLRKLSEELSITKDTVLKVINRIKSKYSTDKETIDKILNSLNNE